MRLEGKLKVVDGDVVQDCLHCAKYLIMLEMEYLRLRYGHFNVRESLC